MPRKKIVDVVTQMERLVKARFCEEPLWLRPVQEVPPDPMPLSGDKTYQRLFPKKRLAKAYWKDVQHENGLLSLDKLPSLGLSKAKVSVPPEIAFEFAAAQIKLMEQGISEAEAFKMVKENFAEVRSSEIKDEIEEQSQATKEDTPSEVDTEEFYMQASEAFKAAMKAELEQAKSKFEKLRQRANEKK